MDLLYLLPQPPRQSHTSCVSVCASVCSYSNQPTCWLISRGGGAGSKMSCRQHCWRSGLKGSPLNVTITFLPITPQLRGAQWHRRPPATILTHFCFTGTRSEFKTPRASHLYNYIQLTKTVFEGVQLRKEKKKRICTGEWEHKRSP